LNRRIRVGIDARGLPLGATPTGTWRVIEQLTIGLLQHDDEFDVRGFSIEARAFGEGRHQLQIMEHPADIDVLFRPHQVVRPRELGETFDGPWKVIVNHLDTILTDHPAYHPSKDHFALTCNVTKASLRYSDMVTTLTNYTRGEILRFCPDLEPRRLAIVGCGVDHSFDPLGTHRPLMPPLGPFLLVIGAAYAHKNRTFAIEVLDHARRLGFRGDLVMAGPEPAYGGSAGEERELAIRLGLADAVRFLGPVSEPEKWWLLSNADAVLYPSLAEGFGLVPFEAATAGTPCLAGSVASLPEVCGPLVRLEKTWNPEEWARTLMAWQRNRAAAQLQIDQLKDRGATLNWGASTEALCDAIRSADTLPKRWPKDGMGPKSLQVVQQTFGLAPLARIRHQVRRGTRYVRRRAGRLRGG
jgi:glycosyltransferase involved in cell wall biosynthesis